MLALTAPLLGFVLGAAFAWVSGDEIARSKDSSVSRSLVAVTLFSLMVYAPIAAYFLAVSPDWTYAYLVDPDRIPRAADLAAVLLNFASVPAGFLAAARAAASRHQGTVVRIAAGPAVLVLANIAAALPRLSVHATHAQFHGDFGVEPLSGSPLGYALIWMSAVLAGSVAWTVRGLRRMAEAARRG